jgi:hypothetical protein
MTVQLLPAIFALDIGGKPTLAFEARNLREAQEIRHEAWLREDMARLKSEDVPLWDGKAKLRVRYASGAETATYLEAARNAEPQPEEIALAFLVALDGDGDDKPPPDAGELANSF